MIYTGIGSRKTPVVVQARMIKIAHLMADAYWTLRSGGADGADDAFEHGAKLLPHHNMEIYLPWKTFLRYRDPPMRNPPSPPYFWDTHIPLGRAMALAEKIHPAWHNCSPAARLLHTRNICQILGLQLDKPSDAVICWTADGIERGGTRTALVLASRLAIPIWNLCDPEHADKTAEQIVDEVLSETAFLDS